RGLPREGDRIRFGRSRLPAGDRHNWRNVMAIVIIGAGSWGTTLSGMFNPEIPVKLWCRSPELVASTRKALKSVAGTEHATITVEPAFSSPLTASDIVVIAVPSAHITEVARR